MIFIPYNVPSSKNSKNPFLMGKGKNQRIVLTPSKTVKKYLQLIGVKKYRSSLSKKQVENGVQKVEEYATRPNLFRESVGNYFKDIKYPAEIGFHFVRDTKRKFDFHNAVQIIADLLVAHECIEDDDMTHFIPVAFSMSGCWFSLDKEDPGVFIKILDNQSK